MNPEKKKKVVWVTISIVSILLIVIGISYAWWTLTFQQSGMNQITSKCFRLEFLEEDTSNITLRENYPIVDEDGRNLVPYTFKIVNNCPAKAKYTIRFEIEDNTTMNEGYIKSLLNEGVIRKLSELPSTEVILPNASKSYVLEEMTINGMEEKNYELRLWIDGSVRSDNQEVMNKIFQGKVTVEGDYDPTYTESILNGTDPVLKDGLVPVTIDNNGVVRKADTNTAWYKYEDKVWANAVILEDETKVYQNNEEIPEDNIESYFVWIPRYRYQIFDNGLYYELSDSKENKVQEIKIEFENRSTRASKGTKKGDWLTHPAFTSFDVNGIWVGKFETGYKGATTTTEAEQNVVDTSKVEIKPNVYSWRNIQVANAHLNSYNYKREYDSHMMKNTEWGAVAYLSHSIYGNMSNIRMNNNSSLITGYVAVNEPTCGWTGDNRPCNLCGISSDITQSWYVSKGTLASTTGNKSGIYDMSGGAWEIVMGVMADKNGYPVSGRNDKWNSNFIGSLTWTNDGNDTSKNSWTASDGGIPFPDVKYYDLYSYSSDMDISYNYQKLGDATGEMGPFFSITYDTKVRKISSWYYDEGWFLYYAMPWFMRGGSYADGISAGIFTFNSTYASQSNAMGYRIVLAI